MRRSQSLVLSLTVFVLGARAYCQSPENTYKEKCLACHGASGLGNTPIGKALAVPPFTGASVIRKSDSELALTIKNGAGKMPAFQGRIQDQEVAGLIRYVHQLQGKK